MWWLPVCRVRWRQNFIKLLVAINLCARSLILKASMVKYQSNTLTLDRYLIDTPSALTFINISVNSWLRGLWLIFDQFINESVNTWPTMNRPTVNQVSIDCRPSINQNVDRGNRLSVSIDTQLRMPLLHMNQTTEFMKYHIFELWGKIWRHDRSSQL